MPPHLRSLREILINTPETGDRFLWGMRERASLPGLARGSRFAGRLSELGGQSVVLVTHDQLITALALIELDGVVRRLTLCPPDLSSAQLLSVARTAEADAIVSDSAQPKEFIGNWVHVSLRADQISPTDSPLSHYATEWILLTSGSSGAPKLVLHSLASLGAAIEKRDDQADPIVWGTFYNICRYGGLQILLRTILGDASLVLSEAEELPAAYLARLVQHRATHLLGTPTHWRRALMSPLARDVTPRYVRLSGEIADQAILDALRSFYPDAVIAHAFASTEAGVGFAVNDGLAGFPASFLDDVGGNIKLKVEHGSLRICSSGTASCYLGGMDLRDQQQFVDTGDAVELHDGRYYFLGRVSGVINVGGLKVHPEEVETVINRHPRVELSLVKAKKNPIMGSIVVADVVLKKSQGQQAAAIDDAALKSEISDMCRAALERHKIPVSINVVRELPIGGTGKLIRHG